MMLLSYMNIPQANRYQPPRYCKYANLDSIDTALRRWRIKKAVNVPKISVYSIRHRITSVLRGCRASGFPFSLVTVGQGNGPRATLASSVWKHGGRKL
jgi:hypothetical protein